MDNNKVPRPVRSADLVVVLAELAYNLSQVVETFFGSLLELSVYRANRETELSKAWQDFTQDLETIQEDTDGAN